MANAGTKWMRCLPENPPTVLYTILVVDGRRWECEVRQGPGAGSCGSVFGLDHASEADLGLGHRVVVAALQEMGVEDAGSHAWYSQTAGCECGCSPGWALPWLPTGPIDVYLEEVR